MIACYDLARCPPTYDVVAFLALAELERLRRKEVSINIHILPGPAGGFRRDGLWPRTTEERARIRNRVLIPLCRTLPSVQSVTLDEGRAVEGWGKGEYHISLPAIMRALRGGSRPLRSRPVPRWPKLVTFTLREAEHHSLRNSRTDEWVAAARELRGRGHAVVIVRDTCRAAERIPDVLTAPAAAHDVLSRAGLYAQADLNVGICNGPMWMSIFMGAPTLMLRPTTDAAGGCYDDRFYAQHGLPRGSQLPTSPPHQRLVWEEDTRENIIRAAEGMLCVITKNYRNPDPPADIGSIIQKNI